MVTEKTVTSCSHLIEVFYIRGPFVAACGCRSIIALHPSTRRASPEVSITGETLSHKGSSHNPCSGFRSAGRRHLCASSVRPCHPGKQPEHQDITHSKDDTEQQGESHRPYQIPHHTLYPNILFSFHDRNLLFHFLRYHL